MQIFLRKMTVILREMNKKEFPRPKTDEKHPFPE